MNPYCSTWSGNVCLSCAPWTYRKVNSGICTVGVGAGAAAKKLLRFRLHPINPAPGSYGNSDFKLDFHAPLHSPELSPFYFAPMPLRQFCTFAPPRHAPPLRHGGAVAQVPSTAIRM